MNFATTKRGKKKTSTTHLTKRRSKKEKRRSRVRRRSRRRSRPFGNSVTAQPGQWGGGSEEDDQGPLPEGWKCQWDDEKGRYLYYNRKPYKLTQWQRPTLSALDAYNLKQNSSKTKAGLGGDEGRGHRADLKKLNEQLQMERHQRRELIRKEKEAKAELNRVLSEMEDLKRKLNECKEEEEAEEEEVEEEEAEEEERPPSIKERGEILQKKGLMGLGGRSNWYRPLVLHGANESEEAPKKLTQHPTSTRAARGKRRPATRRKRARNLPSKADKG